MAKAETKQQRFERLAQRRVTAALDKLRLVGNLSNRQNYQYSEDHVRQIVDALEGEMRQLKQRFRQEEALSARTFAFKK